MVYLLGFDFIVPAFVGTNKAGLLDLLAFINSPDRLPFILLDHISTPVAECHNLRLMGRHVYTLCILSIQLTSADLLMSAYLNTHHPGNIGILFYRICYLAYYSSLSGPSP